MTGQVKINLISDQETENIDSVNIKNKRRLTESDFEAIRPEPGEARVLTTRPRKKGKIRKIIASLAIIVVIAFAVFSSSIIFSNENLIKSFTNLSFLSQIGGLIVSSDRPLLGEQNDRINILLMGIGGADHEGGNLTDTMILLTFKPSTKQVALLSLPRDMYVKEAGVGWTKINAVNAYAEAKNPGSGGETTRNFINSLLNTNVDYYVTIDFSGFEKLIDEFGGVDIYVDNDLVDYQYPILGKENDWPIASRYEILNIKKGWHHFDGATALKYARSRHALGNEGSDFARSKRQQKVLIALKDKVTQFNYLLNPSKISSLMDAYSKNVSTNLQMWEILKLGKLAQEADVAHPVNYSLIEGHTPLLYDQIVNDAYVLLPYGGSFDKIGFVWKNIFTVGTSSLPIDYTKWAEFKDQTSTKATTSKATSTIATSTLPAQSANVSAPFSNETLPAAPVATPVKEATYQTEGAKIEIQNGTNIAGWASTEAAALKTKGFNVVKTGNAAQRSYTSTKIYDFSGGKYLLTNSELQTIFGVSATPPPAGIKSSGNILIILGK